MVLATGLEAEPYVELVQRAVAFADVSTCTSPGIVVGCKLVQPVVAAFLAHLQLIIIRNGDLSGYIHSGS